MYGPPLWFVECLLAYHPPAARLLSSLARLDVNGPGRRRLIDVHLNGGTYNVGHRNPELVDVFKRAA